MARSHNYTGSFYIGNTNLSTSSGNKSVKLNKNRNATQQTLNWGLKRNDNSTKMQPKTNTTLVSPATTYKSGHIKPTQQAVNTKVTRKHTARLQIALNIGKHDTKTANDIALDQIKELLTRYQKSDDKVAILPWNKQDMTLNPAITTPSKILNKIWEFKKVYATGIRSKSNSTCWYKLHIACNKLLVHLTSTNESETNDYFFDTDNKAYLCSVQDSDDTVDLCNLIYSGPFTNYMDVENTHQDHPRKQKREWRMDNSGR
jgi:hypothetical protein